MVEGEALSAANAYGGTGGYAYYSGITAGNGGTASATANGSSGSGYVQVGVTAQGGAGGYGDYGANAGNGASVSLSNVPSGSTPAVFTCRRRPMAVQAAAPNMGMSTAFPAARRVPAARRRRPRR
jgi:hypothetical protein